MLITGTKEQVHNFLKTEPHEFYVYVLCEPNKTPFYVGKGCGNRIFQHEYEAARSASRNPYKTKMIKNITKKDGKIIYTIDSVHKTEEEALIRERELMREIGRPLLTNLSEKDYNTTHGRLYWSITGMLKGINRTVFRLTHSGKETLQ
ncbi:MAG: GIY-YIG nuclease family protein [Alphaproteobacteria bacterium]|nr:GIY-YIG nuclease family protein [Alphaproteobacteria bacterium]